MHFRSLISVAGALIVCASALAQDFPAGELRIKHPYARSTVPHQPSGAAYFSIENTGKQSDKLLSIRSAIARSAEIHTMSMDGNVMRMREVDHIEIRPSARIDMKPGDGYHIMLIGLKQTLKTGDRFSLTLSFEKSGKIDVPVLVE